MAENTRLQAELRASLGKMELALDAIDEALVWTDAEGRIEWCNRAFETLSARPRIECLARPLERIMPLRDDDGRGPAEQLRASPTGSHRVYAADDGRTIEAQGSLIPGKLREMTFVLRDITARRRAEEALSRLAAVVDSTLDAVISEDLSARIQTWNGGAERLYGWTSSEAVGRNIAIVVPEDRSHEIETLRARARAGETVVGYETRRMRKDGQILDVSITVSPVRRRGEVVGYSLIVRDIGPMKEMMAELRRKNHELDAFSYSVAHDLRAPLRQIDGWCHLLLAGKSLGAEASALVERVRSSERRMAGLVGGLLELGRLTTRPLEPSPTDLSAMASAIAGELAALEPDRRVTTSIESGLRAVCDPTLMRSALYNLLDNGWKFTRGRPDARIEFGQETGGTYFVRDNGAGFDMAHAGKLFRAYERLHSASEFPGTGIGLVGVRRIVERHGGRIWAEAAPGRGATFRFTLPS